MKHLLLFLFSAVMLLAQGLEIPSSGSGSGRGKHVVLVSGDEEYRSEEALPQLARILARHGFRCTVLFAIEPADGTVNPNRNDNIPGLEALETADVLVLFVRWRDLPDDQMGHFENYVRKGKPVVGMRTASHPFRLRKHPAYARWSSDSKEWDGGFGRQILGETWISHHGLHGKQSTLGVPVQGSKHPILRGVRDVWGPTDVSTVRQPFPPENDVLMLGQVLTGMNPSDPPLEGPKNSPMMPIAWTRSYSYEGGPKGRAYMTTMGSAQDVASEGFRRLMVNAVFWAAGLEKWIRPHLDVSLVGKYQPSPFRNNGFHPGRKPSDF